jgi:LysR family transcriptional regulator AphB
MDWIAEFLAAHPKVRTEFLLSDARADLIGESIDVAFRAGHIIEPNLIARQVGTSRAMLVAGPSYLATRGTPLALADLADHDCITFPKLGAPASWSINGPEGDVEIKVTGRFSANSAQALLHAALSNLGVALLPTVAVAPHLATGRLVQVLPGYGMNGLGVYLVYLSRKQLPRAVSALIDFTTAKVQAHLLA